MLYDSKKSSLNKQSLSKRAESFTLDFAPTTEGMAAYAGPESNAQVTDDILDIVDKLSERFKDTFNTVTDPEVYRRINDSIQQMDQADLARIGAMLGGGTVGFRRALAGDSPSAVLRGVATGAALGAAGGYFLPSVLDAVVGAKQASFTKNCVDNTGHVKTALGPLIPLLAAVGAAGAALYAMYRWGYSAAQNAVNLKQLQETNKQLQESLNKQKWNDVNSLLKFDKSDAMYALAGGGLGSLAGYLYSWFKNRGKDEDDEERVSPVLSSLVGGGVGSLVGLLSSRALAHNSAPGSAPSLKQ